MIKENKHAKYRRSLSEPGQFSSKLSYMDYTSMDKGSTISYTRYNAIESCFPSREVHCCRRRHNSTDTKFIYANDWVIIGADASAQTAVECFNVMHKHSPDAGNTQDFGLSGICLRRNIVWLSCG